MKFGYRNLPILAGIVLVAISILVSLLFYKQMQEDTAKMHSLTNEIGLLSAERVRIAEEIKMINEEKQRLQDEAERYNDNMQTLRREKSEIEMARGGTQKELLEKETLVAGLQNSLNTSRQQESELNMQLENAKSEYRAVLQRLEEMRREKMALEENLKARLSTQEGVELKKIVVKLAPAVEGQVTEVNREYSFAIIDMGAKKNLQSGDIIGIYRNNELIAKAVVENVYEDMSSIILLDEWSGVDILAKDTVKVLSP